VTTLLLIFGQKTPSLVIHLRRIYHSYFSK
jgi:hypothetical protein